MTAYLDTSALVKLYAQELGSDLTFEVVGEAHSTATSRISYVEARAAMGRKVRLGEATQAAARKMVERLNADWPEYLRIDITEELTRTAGELSERHGLKGADAIQLASALRVARQITPTLKFVAFDAKLCAAARAEQLHVVGL